jgi:tetratricopeptide (TPR) repeat protein
MLLTRYFLLLLSLSGVIVQSHVAPELRTLVAGQAVEREIAGGELHMYQITLKARQFVRFRLDQRAIDATLVLTAPDDKQLVEMNLTGAGREESLSMEATTPGNYRLTVRGGGVALLRGSYRLEVKVKEAATPEDKKRLTAEALMIESIELARQQAKTAPQVIEKSEQSLRLWQELGEPSMAALSLSSIATAYEDQGQYQRAIEYHEQTLTINREAKNRVEEAGTLYSLGRSYGRLGQYEKAIQFMEQATAIYREVDNRAGLGRALGGVGVAYLFLGRYEKGIEYLEQALPIYRELKDRYGEGLLLNNLGASYHYLGRYEKAIDYVEQALAISREVKNKTRESAALQPGRPICRSGSARESD